MQNLSKILTLSLITLSAVTQVTFASSEQSRHRFCLALQAEISTTDTPNIERAGENLKRQNALTMDYSIFTGLFEEGLSIFKKGQVDDNAIDVCMNMYEDLEKEKEAAQTDRNNSDQVQRRNASKYRSIGPIEYGAVAAQARVPFRAVASTSTSTSDDYCKQLVDYTNCTKEGAEAHEGLLSFYKDWMSKLGLSGNSKKKSCECLSVHLNALYAGDTKAIEADRKEMQDNLKKAVFGQLKKKFLNDYASITENINFYTSAVGGFFGQDPLEQKSKAELLQCSKAEMFNEAVQSKCGKKLKPEEIKWRTNRIFNAYWSGDENEPLSKKFDALNERILILDVDGSSRTADGRVYKRYDHDQYRASLTRTEPRYLFMDSLVKKIMKVSEVSDAVYSSDKAPIEVLSERIHQYAKKNPEQFSREFFDSKIMGPELFKDFKDALTDDSETSSNNIFKTFLREAMGLHPGFDQMLRDKTILKDVVKFSHSRNKTLTQILETKDSGLAEKFRDQCKEVVSEFAELICLDDKQISQALSSEQAIGLVTLPDEKKQNLLREHLCMADPSSGKLSILDNMMMTDEKERISDFHDRMTVAPDQQRNSFRVLYNHFKNNNQEVIAKLDESLEKTKGQISGVRGTSLLSNVFGADHNSKSIAGPDIEKSYDKSTVTAVNTINKTNDTPDIAETPELASSQNQVSNLKEGIAVPDFGPQMQGSQMAQFNTPVYATTHAAAAAATTNTSEAKSLKDMKKEFKDFLAANDAAKEEKVDKLVSATDDSMMKDLMKLREEYSRNQARLNELTNEHQKLKLQQMEKDLQDLESQKAKVLSGTADRTYESERTVQDNNLIENRREIASIAQAIDTGSALSGMSSGGGAAGVSSGRANLNASAAGQQAVATGLPQSVQTAIDSSPAVIVSSQSVKSAGLEIQSNDLSREVMSYIEKGSVDVNTLVKIKTSGMVYKYKVMEDGKIVEKEMVVDYNSLNEDAKKLIDQKIVANGIDLKELEKIDIEMKKLKRSYTYNSLKFLLGEQLKK